MKERTARVAPAETGSARANLKVVPAKSEAKSLLPPTASRRGAQKNDGIEVHEDELGMITAQRMYRMRCECGWLWFELELPRLVKCPACQKLNLVCV